jgi:hypothetical protein
VFRRITTLVAALAAVIAIGAPAAQAYDYDGSDEPPMERSSWG